MPAYTFKSADTNENGTVTIVTNKCMCCGEYGKVTVPAIEWENYMKHQEMFIQDVFRTTSVDDREQIKTGIHPKCWDEMFGTED